MAFDQLQPGEFVFDRTYRGGPRSDDFVLFHITTGKQRTPAVKERFFQGLVERLAKSPGIRPEDVMVIIANSEFEDWSFSSGVGSRAGTPRRMRSPPVGCLTPRRWGPPAGRTRPWPWDGCDRMGGHRPPAPAAAPAG
ncbi:tautomerase family protein [Luteibacter sp. Lutesp34]|uniref:tautomerase family protein n=1 Tax=Luteibacter sp. Lutesp34 TaxID=3243030 RepID=UPI0039B50159